MAGVRVIDGDRAALFDTRLSQASRLAGVSNVEELADVLRTDRKPRLHRAEAEAKAIGETSFFRDRAVFDVLRERVLPELIARRREVRRLRVWSAGCSTGQEAYSVAMVLFEHFPELAEWDVQILGTDLSQQAVASAQTGSYCTKEDCHGMPTQHQTRYMERVGEFWEVTSDVKRLFEFRQADLRDEVPGRQEFDLVLLRHVLLYCTLAERGCVFEGVRRQTADDGVLVLGCGERAEDSMDLFTGEPVPG